MTPINSMNGSILPMSTLLPPAVRAQLVAASKVESRIEAGDSDVRRVTVDAVIDNARASHPHFFNEEK